MSDHTLDFIFYLESMNSFAKFEKLSFTNFFGFKLLKNCYCFHKDFLN